jgi:hypothetical protein
MKHIEMLEYELKGKRHYSTTNNTPKQQEEEPKKYKERIKKSKQYLKKKESEIVCLENELTNTKL